MTNTVVIQPWRVKMQIGDVVYLKSGSRPMTVIQIDGNDVTCVWDGGSMRYPEAALTDVDPSPEFESAKAKRVAELKTEISS
jgi:uncharacterized protein YodC (DUF2158 family)